MLNEEQSKSATQVHNAFQEAKDCSEAESIVNHWLSDPNLPRFHWYCTFNRAAHYGYTPIIESLIERGLNPDINGRIAADAMRRNLYYAESLPVLQAFVKAGYDVNKDVGHEGSALELAVSRNLVHIVKWLLDNGAKPSPYPPDHPNYSYSLKIMTDAAQRGSPEVISLLVERGRVPIKHSRALEHAAYAGRVDNVACLLNFGADIDEIADLELSPLLGYEEKVMDFGNALHVAASGGHVEVVRLLLDRGANPSLKDTRGMTARQRALAAGRTEVVLLFPEEK